MKDYISRVTFVMNRGNNYIVIVQYSTSVNDTKIYFYSAWLGTFDLENK